MKKLSSRRLFLRHFAIATTGMTLLPSSSFANTFSNNESPYDGYNPYVLEKYDLRKSLLFGKYLTIKGEIFNKSGKNTKPNVIVEVWHLSPNSIKEYHRGKIQTNEHGQYQFITDFPNDELRKTSKIYFKISNKGKTYFTELLLNQTGAYILDKHWSENKQLKERLFPQLENLSNSSIATFNMTI